MRIFGKVLQTLRLPRRQSNFKPRRYSSFLCYYIPARRSTLNNSITKNASIRSKASNTGSSNKGSSVGGSNLANILPVALIHAKSPTTSTKIMLIPLNLFDEDDDANNKTMKTLSVIREHARQIEAFTENLINTTESTHDGVPLPSSNGNTLQDDVTLFIHNEKAPNTPNSQTLQPSEESLKSSRVSLYENLERAVAEQEMNRIETHDCFDVAAWNSSKQDLVVYVPENLEEKLQQMAISSMQLAFEMDMSNIRDAIFRTAAFEKINMFKPPTPKSLKDPTLTMKANLDLEKSDNKDTIPLDFNALIQGTVEIDPSKYTPSDLGEIRVPEFNDCVTAIAANICSTALQKGFPADIRRMAYSTNSPKNKETPPTNPHIVCVREGSKGCISPGNAEYPKFVPHPSPETVSNSKEAVKSEKAGRANISSEISLLSSEIIGYNSRGLMSCKAYALALAEATKRRADIDKKNDEIQNPKKEATRKRDKCGDPKNNPCTKPLVDECGKELKKDCPTRKTDDKKQKKDPCKDDPCKKAAAKDTCGGKKKKDKPKGKDICGNLEKGNRCDSETDACRVEEVPCSKPKKKKCILDDPCKDPCEKEKVKKETPDKNKKKCSSATPLLYSAKCPIPKKQEPGASGTENKCKQAKSLCDIKKQEPGTSGKENKCKPVKSLCDMKKQEPGASGKENKCKPVKSLCDMKKQEPGASEKENKCKPVKNLCDMKKQEPGASGKENKCKPVKSLCDMKKQEAGTSGAKNKCKPVKSLCDMKKSKPLISLCEMSAKKAKSCGDLKKSDNKSKSNEAKKDKSASSGSPKSKCKPFKSVSMKESKCGPPKKTASDSKCGSPKKSDSDLKCGQPKKSASNSKCGTPKKSDSDSKCGSPKKSDSDSKCGSPKKSASDSKCGSPKKSDSDSKCGSSKKSDSDLKCGQPKKSASNSKCGTPKKSDSDSKCGSPKKSDSGSKCGPKKSASKSKCGPPKKSDSDLKCGQPKKSASDSKCGSPKKSDSDLKCGQPKKSASDSKCGSPKKSDSDLKCGQPKKSASESKCGPPKKSASESKCGSPKKSASDTKCGPPKKSASDSKGDSKCKSGKSNDGKSGECKRYEGFCKSDKSKFSCSKDKKKDSKCKPIKKLCDDKKSSEASCESKKSSSKSEVESKKDSKSQCHKDKKSTAPNCKTKPGSSSSSSSDQGCKKYSTLANPKPVFDVLPAKRFFSVLPSYNVSHSLILWRQFSSKKNSKGKKKNNQNAAFCQKLQSKPKSKRIDKPERKKAKTDCYADSNGECQERSCKDPKKSDCSKFHKENENLSSLSLRTCLHVVGPFSSLKRRYYGTDTQTTTNEECENENKNDDCDAQEEGDSNLTNGTINEVIRILEPCTVERCLEAIPNFSEYDVLVRTEAVALSGSDLHYYETGGRFYPGMTLGHDATGVVAEVGCSIKKIRPGDPVVVESGLACGICDYCKKGCYNICNQLIFNGFLRKYQVHPADLCHKIPTDVDIIEATLTQTLALGCQACFKAQVLPTTNVLIIGASPTAISAALCARAIGAGNICVASTLKDSLQVIEQTFHFDCMYYEPDMQYRMILECLFSVLHAWPDAVINCAISEKTMNLAVMALKPCGVCVLAECDTECACFNAMDVLMKNLKLLPSFRSINMFPTALKLIEGGKAPIGRLVSRVFEWQEVDQAFRKALHESNVGNKKVIVRCAEEEEDTYKKEDCKT
ncbi:uncharacterized protein LOC129246293 isoform X1 [Anastrepha obliqua]|uniref:uncharacterized protein LOC129246293 isoform X1 n=1 Tax=Anastrepha obliqua TaxID=95512 RepID=UPI00240A65C2|nr:uncharacterized protein LOC129246293 isoform X1 [Anastrepha obliqua]